MLRAWRPWRLLLLVQLVIAWVSGKSSVQAPPPEVAAYAAAAALAALEDAQQLEELVLKDERQRIGAAANPLEVYGSLQESLSLLLDTSLAALRHAATATAGSKVPGDTLLGEAAALEKQLEGLLAAQAKEPIFFWHGPKRLALSKLRKLLGRGPWHEELKALAAGSRDLPHEVEDVKEASPEGPVPPVAVAVDDSTCPKGSESCPLALQQAAAATAEAFPGRGQAVHLLLLPCSEETMRRVGSSLGAAQVYVSLVLPPAMLELQQIPGQAPIKVDALIEAHVAKAVKALGRDIDLLWLPYGAFKKQQWPAVQKALQKPTFKWAYGVHAEVPTSTVAKKLMDRSPAPKAWLTPDDLLRPVPQDAVEAVCRSGLSCVSLPRRGQASSALLRLFFQHAGLLTEASDLNSAELRWAWQRGLAGSIQGSIVKASAAKAPSQLILIAAAAAALRKQDGKTEEPPPASKLEAVFRLGRDSLQQAKSQALQKETGEPGLTKTAMEGLEEQKQQYKANNHVIYRPNFFDDATFAALKAETKRLWTSKDIEANCNLDGVNRLGGYILDHYPSNTSLYNLIYGNEEFRSWVSAVNDEGPMWPSDFPIELREYGTNSKGMGCHPDLQMYKVAAKDLEFAFTVDNDSPCNVTYWDAAGQMHLVQTKPNSMMMVRVNAARHCVSPTAGGTRSILKFIYVGDYRKHSEFWSYTENECADSNPNRKMLADRRAERGEEVRGSLEL